MAASLIHDSSSLKFALNVGTTAEPESSTVSIGKINDTLQANGFASVAQKVDALFDYTVTGHKVQKNYTLNLA